MDHAAQSVRSIRNGAGTARNFDRAEADRIDERGGRTGAALRDDPCVIDQEQRSAARKTAHHRHGRGTFAAQRHARSRGDGLADVRGFALFDLFAAVHHWRGGGRSFDVRRRAAGDGDAFAISGIEMNLGGQLSKMDRRKKLAAAANHDERGGKLWIGHECETSLAVGARGAALIDNGDLCAGDGLSLRVEEPRLERQRASGKSQKKEDRQRGSAATDAVADTPAETLSISRGMTSVSIALRMCFAMRLM